MSATTHVEPITRWCNDIGMFAIDRPIGNTPNTLGSCNQNKTLFCEQTCFNNKFYAMYEADMFARDDRNEAAWQALTGEALNVHLSRKRNQTDRIRLMTRGEAFTSVLDIVKVYDLAIAMPDRQIWIPTRAWRSTKLKKEIEKLLFSLPNVAVLASLDPSNTYAEKAMLKRDGWSTMFFGDDTDTAERFKCPKTWGHVKRACAVCKNGCFKMIEKNVPVHVHLKQH